MKDFGKEILGPVMWMYLYKLHQSIRAYDENDAVVLFATRAGFRIYDLYHAWLKSRNIKPNTNLKIFPNSRLLSFKLLYARNKTFAFNLLSNELNNLKPIEILSSLQYEDVSIYEELKNFSSEIISLHDFMNGSNSLSEKVNNDLLQQSRTYNNFVESLLGSAKYVLLVDSGWKGTSQAVMENVFINTKWIGIYFGCIGRFSYETLNPKEMRGLVFDSYYYNENRKETSFVVHRHLIESFFEPNIESYNKPSQIGVFSKEQVEIISENVVDIFDDVYIKCKDYMLNSNNLSVSKAHDLYKIAMNELHDIICYPSIDDVKIASGKLRSHDIGRSGHVAVTIPPEDRFVDDKKQYRIENSIWETGQAALEANDDTEAKILQNRILNNKYKPNDVDINPHDFYVPRSSVAIITRTKNRPLLLKRAASSVASQTYRNYFWVVVNDGGDPFVVEDIIYKSGIDKSKIIFCNNKLSQGMEAASNLGIQSSFSDYIVIHDDDDSWEPDFLLKSITFLECNRKSYEGVITGTIYVSEKIENDHVTEVLRKPYNDWIRNIQLSEMIIGNYFAPISFVFSRRVYESIGGFDENLPVLGDWDFNLRFLLEADIGVITEELALYHHRDAGQVSPEYSNSVVGGIQKHEKFNAIVRNKYIRLSQENSKYQSLGIAMLNGYNQSDLRSRIK